MVSEQPTSVTEKVGFRNDEITFAGTLSLPATDTPHPAVVFVHGAGPQSRKSFRRYIQDFASHGIASLAYDKRGVGESTGDSEEGGFDDLAGDALAGIRFLQGRGDIEPSQIGILGESQGGWIGPLAARSSDVAFVISVSGPGVTPHEQNLYQFRHGEWHPFSGIPEADWTSFVESYRRFNKTARRYLATGEGWEETQKEFLDYLIRIGAISPEQIDAELSGVDASDPILVPYVQSMISKLDYDPVPVLEKVRCPVLAIWGADDTNVPVDRSIAVFDEALRRAGNKDYTLKIFPNADHGLQLPPAKRTSDGEFVPGYLETITDWILERVDLPG